MRITLLGNPYSTNSLYRHARGISYMTKKGRELKVSYIKQIQEQYKKKPLTDELSIEVHIYFGNLRVHDWDNFHKISMDAMTGIVWVDDVQIYKATVEKHYDKANPRIEIIVDKYK